MQEEPRLGPAYIKGAPVRQWKICSSAFAYESKYAFTVSTLPNQPWHQPTHLNFGLELGVKTETSLFEPSIHFLDLRASTVLEKVHKRK